MRLANAAKNLLYGETQHLTIGPEVCGMIFFHIYRLNIFIHSGGNNRLGRGWNSHFYFQHGNKGQRSRWICCELYVIYGYCLWSGKLYEMNFSTKRETELGSKLPSFTTTCAKCMSVCPRVRRSWPMGGRK
jgi:hypothetical protein